MPSKIHILRPESVTPIERHFERVESGAASPAEFACVLLYREREYRAMYSGAWRPEHLPQPGEAGPFAPYALTREAADAIATTVRQTWGLETTTGSLPREDPFGLKEQALTRLRRVLARSKRHAFAHLVAARLATDLCEYQDAIDLARQAIAAGADPITARAVEQQAALLAPQNASFDAAAVAAAAARDARARLVKEKKWRHDWDRRTLERLDEQVRRRALAARAAAEGTRFTRYLTTEAGYCERERREALAGFDRAAVPQDLRALIAVARRFGVGDDVCRALFIRKAPAADRKAAIAAVDAAADRIDRWLKSESGPPYRREAAAFFWLLEAVEEMKDARSRHDG